MLHFSWNTSGAEAYQHVCRASWRSGHKKSKQRKKNNPLQKDVEVNGKFLKETWFVRDSEQDLSEIQVSVE